MSHGGGDDRGAAHGEQQPLEDRDVARAAREAEERAVERPRGHPERPRAGDVELRGSTNVLVRSTGPYVGVIGVNDIVVVAEPDAVLVCHRKDSQAVKSLVDGLKAKGRSIASRKSAAPNGTETLVSTEDFEVELRRAPAGETVALPISTLQVLEGVIEMGGDVYTAGAVLPLEREVLARAIGAATLLVTKPR